MSEENNKKQMGRPVYNEEQKKASDIIKRMKHGAKTLNDEAISKNELNYHFVRHGLISFAASKEEAANPQTSGFAMVVLAMYKKAFEGDLKATELILKLSGSLVDKVDHVSTDGSMSPTTETNIFNSLSKQEVIEMYQKRIDIESKK